MSKLVLPPAKSVEYGTPSEVVRVLANRWAGGAFDMDVAASESLHVADQYYTERDNGLTQEWHGRCFCNPPYGKHENDWVFKGRLEVLSGRASVVVMLLPSKTDKAWWREQVLETMCPDGQLVLRYPVQQIFFWPGRIKFLGASNHAAFGSVALGMWLKPPKSKRFYAEQLVFSFD